MNALIETLNAWAEQALRFAWPMLWQSSLLIGLLFALDLLLRRRLRPAVRYALWLVVLVKLVLPPSLAFPTNPRWWVRPASPVPARPPTLSVEVSYGATHVLAPPATPVPVLEAPPPPRLLPGAWGLVGAGAVSLGLLAWMLGRWRRVSSQARRAVVAPAEIGHLLPELPRPARLRLVDGSQSPAVCGLFRPVILLPRSLVEQLPPAQLRAVLLHELVHLRRGDVWVNCLQALLQIAYWWHPLLWLANARIRRAREEAVDDAVMLALNEDADTYAPTLLEVAKLSLSRPLATLGLVGILESRSSLRLRIERLMGFHPPRKAGLTLASAIGVLGFAALAVPMGEASSSTGSAGSTTQIVTNNLAVWASSNTGPSSDTATGVRRLVQDGKLLYEMGRLGAAQAKLEQALKQDPLNAAANYYMDLVRQARLSPDRDKRKLLPWAVPAAPTNLLRASTARAMMVHKLLNTRLDEISFKNVPLIEVLRGLAEESRKRDPEKRGVNFLVSSPLGTVESPVGTLDSATAPTPPSSPAPPASLASLPITIYPLTNLCLADVLGIIVKVAPRPIRYSIEDYAVVFSLRPDQEPSPLYIRTFKVDPNTLIERLGIAKGPMETNVTGAILPTLVKQLAQAGVDLDPLKNPGKSVLFSDRNGMLLVRATLQDFDTIERELAALAQPAEPATATADVAASTAGTAATGASASMEATNPPSLDLKIKAATLVRDGKLLYEMGKLDEAEAKLKLALEEDPHSEAALYYRNLVAQAKFALAAKLHDVTMRHDIRAVEQAWANPVKRESQPDPNPHARSDNLVYTGLGRQAIITKLDRIRLDRVSFDKLPLIEVARYLTGETQKHDPDKLGVKILIERLIESPKGEAPIDYVAPSAASPTPATPAGVDASIVPITIQPPLTDIRLADVLDAIVKVADQPIKYSIQDNAVVFSARLREPTPLYIRTFKVDPDTFYRALQDEGAVSARKSFELPASNTGGAGFKFIHSNNSAIDVSRAARNYFERLGANLDPVANPGKSVFVNDRQGMLLVRATLQDLDIIEAGIAVLNNPPPQVNIKVKFVEVPQDDTKALGFDWYLGNVLMTNGAVGGQAGTAPSNAISPLDMNPVGAFPGYPSGAAPTNLAPNSTNGLLTSGLRNSSTTPATLTGILTGPQYRAVIQALQQRSGTEFLAQPEVTTISGRQAQMKSVTIQHVIAGIDVRALTPPGITTTNDDDSAVYVADSISCGPTIDVTASVLADGYTIALNVLPSVTEFLGYQQDQTNRVAVWVNGKDKGVVSRWPIVRQRQMSASVRVRDGQTLVLGGLPSETVYALKDKVPMLGDLPLVGRLFRSESRGIQKKNLLIFITPTLIDPAGNRMHTEDELPFTRNAVPPQPAR